jgi:hypothetical protein
MTMFRSPFAARRLGRAPRRCFQPRPETLEDRLTPSGYSLTDLGAIGDPKAINNSGLVATTIGSPLLGTQAYLYNINTHAETALPTLPSGFETLSLIGINDSGQIFVDSHWGYFDVHQAFRYNSPSDSHPTQLGPPIGLFLGLSPVAVNNLGQVLYNTQASLSNGFYPELYDNVNGFHTLYRYGMPTGYSNFEALGLNNYGQILVGATTSGGTSGILLGTDGHLTVLGVYPWSFNKVSTNGVLNDSGQAAINPVDENGVYHVVLYNGKWTDLNSSLPPGYSDPILVGMNDAGQILADAEVGSGPSTDSRPLLYSNGQWSDLNNLIPSGSTVTLIGAGGINNNAQIVAQGSDGNVYLLTPQQAPTHQDTTTSLVAAPDNVPAGQSVTLTATVTTFGTGGIPGGSVTFVNGLTPLGTVTLTSGTASLTTTTLPAGDNSITVTYNGFTQGNTVYNTSASPAVTVTVTATAQTAPTITSSGSTTFTIGQGGSFTVTATGSPTPTLTESGTLPAGIAFWDNGDGTASLAGTPSAGTQGTYYFTITAHNGVGNDALQNFALTVNPVPVPPSPPSPPSAPPPPPLPSPTPAPTLNVPPLLALLDGLLGGTETVNANGTETITDSLFGIPLLVSTFDHSGHLVSVTLFGIDIAFLFA